MTRGSSSETVQCHLWCPVYFTRAMFSGSEGCKHIGQKACIGIHAFGHLSSPVALLSSTSQVRLHSILIATQRVFRLIGNNSHELQVSTRLILTPVPLRTHATGPPSPIWLDSFMAPAFSVDQASNLGNSSQTEPHPPKPSQMALMVPKAVSFSFLTVCEGKGFGGCGG